MAVEISLLRICISHHREIIFSGNDLFTVRIVNLLILCMAVTCITYGKMRSCLLSDQYREKPFYVVIPGHFVCRCIRSYGKLSEGKGLMLMQEVFFDELPVVFLILIVIAGIIAYHTVRKGYLEVFVQKPVQIHF